MIDRFSTAAAALLAACLLPASANAQFMNLPQNDFTWRWGDDENAGGIGDFHARGSEGGFNCTLEGALRLGSRYTQLEIRELESELNISLFFIQAATSAMNQLDWERQLDWAVLDCVRPKAREPDAEAQQQRLDKLRERALKKQAERRERREREQARAD